MSPVSEMQIKKEEINPCTVLLNVVCSTDQVRAGYDKAYRQAAKKVKIPGFRPGTAPKNVVKQYVNPEYLEDLAKEAIVSSVSKSAIKEHELKPYGRVSVEVTKLNEENEECEFSVKVPLEPIVKLGNLEGITIQKPRVEVSDEEVEEQIAEIRKKKAKRVEVKTRGAQLGDSAVITIKPEGDEFTEGRFLVEIGQTFPQLDQALLGMTIDDIKQVSLTFPDSFQDEKWRGQTLDCQLKIRSLSAHELPELTDEFAQQFSAESVDDLKKVVREKITEAKTNFYNDYAHEQLLDELIKSSEIIIPDNLWENVANNRLYQIAQDAEKNGVTLQDVAQQNNMTVEQLVERVQQEAQAEVKRALAISTAFKQLDLKLTKDDLGRHLAIMANEYQVSPQELAAALRRTNQMDELNFRAMRERVLNILMDKANVQEMQSQT